MATRNLELTWAEQLEGKKIQVVETIKFREYTIKIIRDPKPTSPAEYNSADQFVVADHEKFSVKGPNGETAKDITDNLEKLIETYHVYILMALFLNHHPFLLLPNPRRNPKDLVPEQIGYVLVTRDKVRSLIEKPKYHASAMLDEWNAYLAREVYGYQVTNADGKLVEEDWDFYSRDLCKKYSMGVK
jgi:hypothetical protein